MLRKAREKAKEGLRSVNAETKRYIQTKTRHGQYGGGRGRPRQTPASSRSAAVSFKGFSDDFEAILNDDSDFTNQFAVIDEADLSTDETHLPSSSTVLGEEGWTEDKAFADHSDLFSDPIFPETEHDPVEPGIPSTYDVDPLMITDTTPIVHDDVSHQESELPSVRPTVAMPVPDVPHLFESEGSGSPVAELDKRSDETHPPEQEGHPLQPDSPLFSDDVHYPATSKEGDVESGSHSRTNVFVTQPSDEAQHDQPVHSESQDWLFGERPNQHKHEDETADLPKTINTPDLPDIEELERKLAVNRLGDVQDLFSSEESPFSSLASSYEGDKGDMGQRIRNATFPSTETSTQDKLHHNKKEMLNHQEGKEESGGLTGGGRTGRDEEDQLAIDKELEALLTPKPKPKMSDSNPVSSTIQPAVDDPLLSASQLEEEEGRERVRNKLDSGVFEQSSSSVVLKPTPEREGGGETNPDDLFTIDDDHFKDDDSTPVLTKRQLTKGSSNIEVTQSKKGLYNTLSAPTFSPSIDSVKFSSPPKKNPPGKTAPPPRPAISPKLKHRIAQKQQADSSGAGGSHEDGILAKKKVVQPLGHAPQRSEIANHLPTQLESLDTSLSSESATVPPRVPQTDTSPTKSDDRRLPADDLFLEDNLVPPSGLEKPTTDASGSGEPSQKTELEQGVAAAETSADPEDESTDYSFLYHLLFAYLLYLYYSLNIFPYLSGFFAGFFVLYLTVGSVFIFYVQTVEKYQSGDGARDTRMEPSQQFTEHMHVDFDNLSVYKSKRFTATLTYDPATHHPSQRIKAIVHLVDDFELYVRVAMENSHTHNGQLVDTKADIRDCTIALVPDEVAKNRKRRWSKKFPIMIFKPPPNTYRVYLFSPHARDKEDWYRRLKHANNGFTTEQAIKKEMKFFAYMENYFPLHSFPKLASVSSRPSSKKSSRQGVHPRKPSVPRVRYSVNQENDDVSKDDVHESVSFKGSSKPHPASTPSAGLSSTRSYGESSNADHSLSHTRSVSSSIDSEFEVVPRPPKLTKTSQLQWLNAVAARLCWDIWHEQRWKDWVTTRIQKKLIRVKTPSFMEQLRLTSVDLGNDMPVVQQLREGPKLDLRGIWVFLDVTYSGNFVMTIETKMKLGGKESHTEERGGQQMSTITRNKGSGLPQSAPHRASGQHHSRRALSHQHAAKALGGLEDSYEQEIDSGSDDEESATGLVVNPLEEDVVSAVRSRDQSTHAPEGKKDKLISVVSRITKKVANAKIVQRAAQKVSSYPLVLTVVVKGLDGVLAVNIPPPPTDTIWYGFKNPPKLTLVAKPRLGNREVKLSRVTHWIERKLQELVNKKLVLPEMEDLVIPILNSGIPEDELKPISSDSTPSAT